MPDIFKNSDVRGKFPGELDEALTQRLARAFGELAEGSAVVLGGDTRDSSPALMEAARKGLSAAGCRVLDAGVVTTPMLNFARIHFKAAGSLMVTASHNPPDQNGLKPGLREYPLGLEAMRSWKRLSAEKGPGVEKRGSITSIQVLDAYAESLKARFGMGSLPVVVDPGGGAACGPAPEVLRRLGHPVEVVNGKPGLSLSDRPPDPVLPGVLGSLIKALGRSGQGLGLAFDGDGDRMAAVDEKGCPLSTDSAMSLFARRVLRDHPGGLVIFDVKMSRSVEDAVREAGGKPLRCPTGQLNVIRWLRERGGVLAGEYSGHYVFPDYAPHDDALAASLMLLRIVEEAGGSLAALAEERRGLYHASPELRFPVTGNPQDLINGIRRGLAEGVSLETIDGVRASYPEGWALARASGTEEALSFRFESLSGAAGIEPLAKKFLSGAPAGLREAVLRSLAAGGAA